MSKQDLAHRETPNDFAMQSIAPLVGDDHGLRATATTPAGEDAPDDTFPSFEQALGPDFEYCNTLAIKRFRHLPLHPQHLQPITAFEDIRFVLRSMRIEALQEKHAVIKAAADRERAERALVASPGFSEAMVKHNSQRRKRRRGGRRPKDGQLSAQHPAARARKAGNVRSQ
ncbi:hypothetical protein AC578_1340 [Pseudocercospora eumusae]|uniref:Uncharacterized protein n=1 Tax=Pseudocercospora eumusae TaxID=321146 RepID=A0A139HUI8_9PEZI|nr:hypothetical protein AC578_1340 [Pseudocercospora eumusae]